MTFSILIEMVVVLEAVLGILGISKKGKKVVEWVPLQLRILLQVEVLKEKKVFKGGVV